MLRDIVFIFDPAWKRKRTHHKGPSPKSFHGHIINNCMFLCHACMCLLENIKFLGTSKKRFTTSFPKLLMWKILSGFYPEARDTYLRHTWTKLRLQSLLLEPLPSPSESLIASWHNLSWDLIWSLECQQHVWLILSYTTKYDRKFSEYSLDICVFFKVYSFTPPDQEDVS